jgi:microcystin-dependent protein
MKILDTSAINSGASFPFKSGTINFLQDSHKDNFAEIIKNILGFDPDAGQVYILSGLVNSTTAPTFTVTAGSVYLDGEIYNIDAFTFTSSGVNDAYPGLEITQFTANADPVTFTDGTPRNVHNIRKLRVTNTTGTGLQKFTSWIRLSTWLYGDTKEVVCNSAYITKNFNSTGLGILERTGWAIMNGQNGTPDDDGLVVIGYGAAHTSLGFTAGEETHSLTIAQMPNHSHTVNAYLGNENVVPNTGTGSNGGNQNLTTSAVGGGEAHNNMQPYVIRLRIMRIK